uniref:Uncharacterized protein n=1 Tax=Candidatus Kentrum sp. UNK TaxID=2126344 RepID=A0A451AWT4_9GAMM|nr:MAG: hypothetical protein BECKUNK1418G_GA0071005_102412 [Candidatus Kentron sp. UNK]VFK70503.1 MAG: hypothetical protein BECKUNK1418H_GA0071006_103012 [Candidatus Kentron sp. UNK]
MKFVPLFSLRLAHSYYADGKCSDFSVTPTLETRRLLENHRCVLKKDADGVRVLAPLSDAGQPLISLGSNAVFAFRLRLGNPDFALFTDLADMDGNSAPVFTNRTLPDATSNSAGAKQLSLILGTARPEGSFAHVEIHNNDSVGSIASGGASPVFRIRFRSKEIRWVYYCLLDPGKTGEPRIVDGEASDPLVFGDGNRTDLTENPDPSDEMAAALARQYPNTRRLRFVSDEPVDCQETARRLALHLDADKLAEALPNPSFRNYAKTKVRVNGALQPQDSLFQVVKFLTANS